MKSNTAQYIEDVFKTVDGLVENFNERMDAEFKGEPYGAHAPTKAETAGFVQMQLKQEPPDWWVWPDGHKEFNSGWLIALREEAVEGGRQAWRKIEKALGG